MARYYVISCEVLFREICFEAAHCPQAIGLTFNRFGLHDVGSEKMQSELQDQIDAQADAEYDAILLGYGLCNNGTAGLRSRKAPLVIPKAHDCITLLLDSKERYQSEFNKEPGTYYKSPGWIEHHNPTEAGHPITRMGLHRSYDELVEEYGEENARYLAETLGNWNRFEQNYTRMAYIDTGLGPRQELIAQTREKAQQNNWRFELLQSDRSLIRKMLCGQWDEADFLVVQPGQTMQPSHNDTVLKAV